ncbi:hypothetical protein Hamer_G010756, partial [Homarus americanus]
REVGVTLVAHGGGRHGRSSPPGAKRLTKSSFRVSNAEATASPCKDPAPCTLLTETYISSGSPPVWADLDKGAARSAVIMGNLVVLFYFPLAAAAGMVHIPCGNGAPRHPWFCHPYGPRCTSPTLTRSKNNLVQYAGEVSNGVTDRCKTGEEEEEGDSESGEERKGCDGGGRGGRRSRSAVVWPPPAVAVNARGERLQLVEDFNAALMNNPSLARRMSSSETSSKSVIEDRRKTK